MSDGGQFELYVYAVLFRGTASERLPPASSAVGGGGEKTKKLQAHREGRTLRQHHPEPA